MPAPTITPLPDAPLRSEDSATFASKAEAFVVAQVDFVSEANAQAAYLDGLAGDVDTAASDALTDIATARSTALTDVGAQVDVAQEWAENPEDDAIPGSPGSFSSLHWSAKSEGHAEDAEAAELAASGHASTASGYASALLAMANPFTSIALGLAGTADGGIFTVLPSADGTIPIYRDNAGTEELLATMFGIQNDHLGRARVPLRLLGDRGQGPVVLKAFADLRAGTTLFDWREMDFGDSLGFTVAGAAMPYVAGFMSSEDIYAYGSYISGSKAVNSATTVAPVYYTGTFNVKATSEYDWSTIGSTVDLDAGEYAIFGGGVNPVTSNTQYGEVCLQPGGGVAKLLVSNNSTTPVTGDVSWRDPTAGEIHADSDVALTGTELLVDTDGAAGESVIAKLQLALGNWHFKWVHVSGGEAKIMGEAMMPVHGLPAINTWRIVAGSNDSSKTTTLSIPATAKKIAKFKPHLLRIGNDDRLGGIQALLPHVDAAITYAMTNYGLTYRPVIEVACMPFYSNPPYDDSDIAEAIDWAKDYAATRSGIVIIDTLAIGGGYTLMNSVGWASDPIHPLVTTIRELIRPIYTALGWLPYRLRTSGGDATHALILTAGGPTQAAGRRLLAVNEAMALVGATPINTAAMTWSAFTGGVGTFPQNAAHMLVGATTAAAGSKIWSYVNVADPDTPWTSAYTSPATRSGTLPSVISFALLVKAGGATDIGRFMIAGDRNYNATHTGAVTAGIGIKFTGTGVITGIGGLSGAEVATSDSFTTPVGFPTARQARITMVWRPNFKPDGTYSAITGTLYVIINGTALTGVELTAGNWRAMRFEAENVSGTNFQFSVSPPVIHTFG